MKVLFVCPPTSALWKSVRDALGGDRRITLNSASPQSFKPTRPPRVEVLVFDGQADVALFQKAAKTVSPGTSKFVFAATRGQVPADFNPKDVSLLFCGDQNGVAALQATLVELADLA